MDFKLYTHPAIVLDDEATTLSVGSQFAACLQLGLIVYLHGDLGAGKTTFTRGVLRGFGYTGKVKSPTYTLVETYDLSQELKLNIDHASFNTTIHHFDLYRFIDEDEWEAAGFRDYFNATSIGIIEWPDKALNLLPLADIDVRLTIIKNARTIQFTANTLLGEQCLSKF